MSEGKRLFSYINVLYTVLYINVLYTVLYINVLYTVLDRTSKDNLWFLNLKED